MDNNERREFLGALEQVRSYCLSMTGGIHRCQLLDRQYQDVMAHLWQARTTRTGAPRTRGAAVVAAIMMGPLCWGSEISSSSYRSWCAQCSSTWPRCTTGAVGSASPCTWSVES